MRKPKIVKNKRVPPRFWKGIISDVAMRFNTARIPPTLVAYLDRTPRAYDLNALVQDGVLYWGLREVPTPNLIAAGWFRFIARPARLLEEVRAGMLPQHRGQGLYPDILKELRRQFKRPLQSDMTLSESNRKAWVKVGALDPESGRIRFNPTESRPIGTVEQQIKWAWLITEGRLPPRKS